MLSLSGTATRILSGEKGSTTVMMVHEEGEARQMEVTENS